MITLCFRRILWQKKCFFPFIKIISSREKSTSLLGRYNDDKYCELRNRLAAVPCLNLINKGIDSVHHAFSDEKDKNMEDISKRFSEVFNYNVTHGKKLRSAALLKAFCTYGFGMDDNTWDQWDSDNWRSAIVVAWCVEMLHANYIVLDDIVDQSELRRGQPCWNKLPGVGLFAIHDALLLQCGICKVLQKHLAGSKYYMNVLQEFLKVHQEIAFAGCLDILFNHSNGRPRFDKFAFEAYRNLTIYKTANLTYRLPVHAAMHLAGGYSVKDFKFAEMLCLKLGFYFQCQDDHLDCFGKSDLTGKIGTDIREGRCTWFAVKFLEEASESMKKQFLENYGVDDEYAISEVLELYRETNLLEKFEEFDEQFCAEFSTLIESKNDIKGALFYNLLAQIQGRNT